MICFVNEFCGKDTIPSHNVGKNPSYSDLDNCGYIRWQCDPAALQAVGETRYSTGLPTKYQYTGQYANSSDFGLMFYNARWYDPYLNRMASPDTIIPDPGNPADYDRFSFVRNNPLKYTDPYGHCADDPRNPEIRKKDQACWDYLAKLKRDF